MSRLLIYLIAATSLMSSTSCSEQGSVPATSPTTQQASAQSVDAVATEPVAISEPAGEDAAALAIFEKRILPIFQAQRPSSCSECHLSGVDLKNYIRPTQGETFAALVSAGLIDLQRPDDSKLLGFIRRQPEKPSLISDQIRKQEHDAFRAWILAAVKDEDLQGAETKLAVGPSVPIEVVRHARKDRVLASFVDNIWSELARCSSCHSPDQNQKQVEEHGEQVSWIKLGDPYATMNYLFEAQLIDLESPENSLLLLKPTMQVEHGGGQKMLVGDRSYRQFRRFIDDYAAIVRGTYQTADQLPPPADEVSIATSMSDGIWLKLENVPADYDQKLLQVDVYRREGDGWSKTPWATADRAVAGDRRLWQQTLSLLAPRGSERAEEIRRAQRLPPGEYLLRIYIDVQGRLNEDAQQGLGQSELVGEVVINSGWRTGYGSMTVVGFPSP